MGSDGLRKVAGVSVSDPGEKHSLCSTAKLTSCLCPSLTGTRRVPRRPVLGMSDLVIVSGSWSSCRIECDVRSAVPGCVAESLPLARPSPSCRTWSQFRAVHGRHCRERCCCSSRPTLCQPEQLCVRPLRLTLCLGVAAHVVGSSPQLLPSHFPPSHCTPGSCVHRSTPSRGTWRSIRAISKKGGQPPSSRGCAGARP